MVCYFGRMLLPDVDDLSIPCRTCGVAIGVRCKAKTGRVKPHPHASRVDDAKARWMEAKADHERAMDRRHGWSSRFTSIEKVEADIEGLPAGERVVHSGRLAIRWNVHPQVVSLIMLSPFLDTDNVTCLDNWDPDDTEAGAFPPGRDRWWA